MRETKNNILIKSLAKREKECCKEREKIRTKNKIVPMISRDSWDHMSRQESQDSGIPSKGFLKI